VRAALSGAAALAAPALWMAMASRIWSWGTGIPYAPPFLQWQQAVSLGWWHANWWCKLWLSVGGAVPTVVLAGAVLAVARLSEKRGAGIYGETQWAGRREMQAQKITTSERPL
jgi:hypothetical protein